MGRIRQDIVFAFRALRRRPAFAAVAIGTIALGTGAATSIFSVVDGVIFRPLAFNEPGRLVAVWQTFPHWRREPILVRSWDRIPLSIPEYRDWRAAQTAFNDVAIWTGRTMTIGEADRPEMVGVRLTSASILSVLDVSPALGRFFSDAEDRLGGPAVTVVSHEAWATRFQRDPGIVGRSVRLDDRPYTIIGVLPAGLDLTRAPSPSGTPAFWMPAGQDSGDAIQRGNHSYRGLARLKPGVSLQAAIQESERILRGDATPEQRGVRLEPWQQDQTREVRKPLFVLLGAVGLLLLIACVNVAVLLLGEASARETEIASRIALGAGRRRIVGQLLTESLVLAGIGAVLGTLLAWAGTRLLVALAPDRIPGLADVAVDLRVLAFALLAALGTGILFGLTPAIALSRSSPGQVFRATSGQSGRGRGRLQRALVAVELALSLTLLVGAALLSRSLNRLAAVDPGFGSANLLAVSVSLPRMRPNDEDAYRDFYRRALERLAAVPGVTAVTASTTAPFTGGSSSSSFDLEGQPATPAAEGSPQRLREAQQRIVIPNYFEVMGIPVLSGRAFDAGDRVGAPLVAIVSRTLARREFPGQSPLGKRVRFQRQWREIVGVVADTKYSSLSLDDQATIYVPLGQRFGAPTLLVRTAKDPSSVVPAVREALQQVNARAVFLRAERMTDLIARSFAEERFRAMLIVLFGVVASALAAVGMYGVTSRAVSRRTHEMGIRIALGASSASVVRLMVRHTLSGLAIGIVLGVGGALLASRALAPFLFGITTGDRVSYLASVALLGAVSLAATWLPARRAARVEPAVILRSE